MQIASNPRGRRFARFAFGVARYQLVEALFIVLMAAAAVALMWALFKPVGPVGRWQAARGGPVIADPLLLTRFDPFFRGGANPGPAAVTSLALKLFGIRVDQAMGRGSAIVATPDGVQGSYTVGDEIVPGVKLKSVAFDHIVLDRGGADEQLYLDQSVAAPVVSTPSSPTAPSAPGAPTAAVQVTPEALAAGIAFSARSNKGVIDGLIVAPKGSGTLFTQTGLMQGDVVTQINGQPVRSAAEIATTLANVPPGGRVNFMVDRNGTTMNFSAATPQ
jgi:general secretion pathway protein C